MMPKLKTPDYTRRAIENYRAQTEGVNFRINPRTESELAQAIEELMASGQYRTKAELFKKSLVFYHQNGGHHEPD